MEICISQNVNNQQVGQATVNNTYLGENILTWMTDCVILLNLLKIWQILTMK